MLLIFAFFWQQKFAILFSKCKGEGDSEGESLLVWGKRFSFFLQTYSLLNVGGKGVIFDPKIWIAFFILNFSYSKYIRFDTDRLSLLFPPHFLGTRGKGLQPKFWNYGRMAWYRLVLYARQCMVVP